ncbi:hypothetical protein F4810DRAFT_723814 [Camillea tinctor]|nr:hypothetical protein F4810DRAFT_723814 [Camillea tinctor]
MPPRLALDSATGNDSRSSTQIISPSMPTTKVKGATQERTELSITLENSLVENSELLAKLDFLDPGPSILRPDIKHKQVIGGLSPTNLIWLFLVQQPPSVASHLQTKFNSTGRRHFDAPNDFLALSTVFYEMIEYKALSDSYFVVGALDERLSKQELPGLDGFLRLIPRSMKLSNKILWVVSSEYLESIKLIAQEVRCLHVKLGPDLHGWHVAMESYVESKVSELAQAKEYDIELKASVFEALCGQ